MADDRLSKQDWVKAGLSALAQIGIGGLKADLLAKGLGVSRGSFYWHFPDVTSFHDEVLAAWEQQATADIIAKVELEGGHATTKLHRLARIVFAGDGSLERQIRAWAAQQKSAAAVQDRVDRRRVTYVTQLLEAIGHQTSVAETRARFLYLSLVGHFSTGRRISLDRRELAEMVDLLLQTD
jgi:AcrR family transcriptional regulator